MYREQILAKYLAHKAVLDCGGVDHWAAELKLARGQWFHAFVCEHAERCLGVDILEERVRQINESHNYRFVVANVEHLSFVEEYDVVTAGELVEHIYNMGLFLDSAWRALRPEGRLIITTPNSLSVSGMLLAALRRRELTHPEHTCYYSPQTLRYIVEKHGFDIEELEVVPRESRFRVVEGARKILARVNPLVADQIVLVGRKMSKQNKFEGKW